MGFSIKECLKDISHGTRRLIRTVHLWNELIQNCHMSKGACFERPTGHEDLSKMGYPNNFLEKDGAKANS